MKTVLINQARMTSTRLPGKVLKEVLGKPLLEYQIERIRRIREIDDFVIATTTLPSDDPIVSLCKKLKVKYFRGSETDVLSRYAQVAEREQADSVVRVTSDCPLLDPEIVDDVLRFFKIHFPKYAYVSNVDPRTFPRGMDTEVFTAQALQESFREAIDPYEKEHVTLFIHRHPERYLRAGVTDTQNHSQHRWTVDTPEDFQLIEKILEALYPKNPFFTLKDLLALLQEHPEWQQINAHVEQKKY